jgi:hypothetical protein
VKNLLGLDDPIEGDPRIFAQVDHGIATQIIVVAFLAVDRDGAKESSLA